MDDFDFHTFEFSKSTTTRSFPTVARIFRYLKLLAAMALFTWLSSRAPLAVKVSGDYFRRLYAAVATPVFGFFLGNAIILAIVVKSGHLARHSEEANSTAEICEKPRSDAPKASPEKKIVFQDKEIVCDDIPEQKTPEEAPRVSDPEPDVIRRPETDLLREVGEAAKSEYPEDLMSSDEFRRTIDEFIARQVKFIREESKSGLDQT